MREGNTSTYASASDTYSFLRSNKLDKGKIRPSSITLSILFIYTSLPMAIMFASMLSNGKEKGRLHHSRTRCESFFIISKPLMTRREAVGDSE